MDKTFNNKVAVITGGTRGIGYAIALRLASKGANLGIIGTSPETTAAVAEQLSRQFAIRAVGYAVNVSNHEAVADTFRQIIADFGTIDILVNNAGINRDSLIMRMSEEDWDNVININLKGAFNCIKAVTKTMLKAKSGRIVNISSIVGLAGNAGQANYAAAKAGIIGLTKSIAKELASRNITVNAIAPVFIITDMTDKLPDEIKAAAIAKIPLGHPGTPDDIAAAVEFLASDDAGFITGQTIVIDGGMA